MITIDQLREELLDEAATCPSYTLPDIVPNLPGYYTIWIDSPNSLPIAFSKLLRDRNTRLLYVGIATRSLFQRLVEQEFEHKKPATFFRSLGAILGYKPPLGSLHKKRNQNNYKFSTEDTKRIVGWINEHLSARFVVCDVVNKSIEKSIIEHARPLINITDNPEPCHAIIELRKECRQIATSLPEC